MGNGKGEGREEEGDPTWYGLLFINNSRICAWFLF